jgi:TolB-like protein/DNA-binding winged helix-turn-helix (wHTH) protein/Tfp pilus assembly protein PilF
MSHQTECSYEFGPFRVDPVKRLLLRDGQAVAVTSKVFDTLMVLVERHGQVLPKDELMEKLWPDTAVEENNLTQQISVLRKALGERSGEHRYIVTVPGRGYSFVAEVREVHDRGSDLILEQRTRSSITIAVEEGDQDARAVTCADDVKLLPAGAAAGRRTRTNLIALGLLILLLGPLTFLTYRQFAEAPRRPAPSPHPKSIAVLPFRSLTSGPGDDFLGAGMSDTLIAKLSNLHEIKVRPTSSVIKYAGAQQDTLAAGRELGVDSVLEGTVQRAGDRVRVTVQLLDVRDGRPLWAESFDERQGDIFAVQDAISEQVAQAMRTRLGGEEQKRLRKHYTVSVEAYEAYLRGRHFWNKRTEEGLRKSIEYFERAIELDPNYALAHAGAADAYGVLVGYKLETQTAEEYIRRARAAALRALEIDETLAEAHASLGLIKYHYDGDNAGAEREYLRAIELNPNYATARQWYADFLLMMYRPEEALAEIRRAQELDPLSPIINTTLGEHLYFSRRYDEAATQIKKTLEIDPDFHLARYLLGLTYEQKGLYGEAISEFQKARDLAGTKAQLPVAALGHAYAVTGREHEARQVLGELFKHDCVAPYAVATVYAGLRDRRQAFAWLQKAHRDKIKVGWLLKTDPRWESFRSDPTFRNLLAAA